VGRLGHFRQNDAALSRYLPGEQCHHCWGYRSHATRDDSTNLWWVAILTLGEGWHNNHHAFPRSARHGLRWWEVDVTYWVIRLLAVCALAKNIHLPTKVLGNTRGSRVVDAGIGKPVPDLEIPDWRQRNGKRRSRASGRVDKWPCQTFVRRGSIDKESPTKEQVMRLNDTPELFSESRRKEIFRALVDAQDQKVSVLQSRAIIAKRFGIDTRQLKSIEQEGIDNDWPPL
jgi:hypothetical protein